VYNEDDCVAITSGQYVSVSNFWCDGSHGLSIGSVGGKSNNTVADITFRDSVVLNAQNGARIKTNSGTTGSITRVLYENIRVQNISIYGVSGPAQLHHIQHPMPSTHRSSLCLDTVVESG
jgi:polygalacturonase